MNNFILNILTQIHNKTLKVLFYENKKEIHAYVSM